MEQRQHLLFQLQRQNSSSSTIESRHETTCKIVIMLFLLTWLSPAYCSPQSGDEVALDLGEKKYVHGFVLGAGAEQLVEKWKEKKGYHVISSGNYDGCYFKLILKKRRLYLATISVDARDEKNGFFMAEIPIGDIYTQEETFADWFTGDLREYFGESIGYTEMKQMTKTYNFKSGELVDTKVTVTRKRANKAEKATTGKPSD